MSEFDVARRLKPLLRLYPWALPVIIVLGVLSSLAEGIGISLFIPLFQSVDQIASPTSGGGWVVSSLGRLFSGVPPGDRLLVISACIFACILLKVGLTYGTKLIFCWLDSRIGHYLRSRSFEQLLSVSYIYLQHRKSGDLLNTLGTETWRTSQALSVLVGLIITACTLTVYTTLLMLISWKLTLIVAAVMLLISALVKYLSRQVTQASKRATHANTELADRMLEGFSGMKVIRVFNRESFELKRYNEASEQVSRAFLRLSRIGEAVSPVHEMCAAALLVFILVASLRTGESLPALLVFIFVLYRLQPTAKSLEGARVGLRSLTGSVEAVTSLLDRSDKPYLSAGTIPCRDLDYGIRLEGITFRYAPNEKAALQDLSIHIPAGKTTAIVGPSGAGKTTLINLILRLYEATDGEIYVDDLPLRTLDLGSWRRRIALVNQDTFIFNSTVRDNIAYGKPDATNEEVIEAAKLADAHSFICELPRGYQSNVGDRGIRLSGGQQQRVTLARAIVRNPDILILDEATNALDSISEHFIQGALDKLSDNRTVIVIAHRFSTIKRADHIIVLEKGRLCEEGDLQQLLDRGGLFATMYNMQYSLSMS